MEHGFFDIGKCAGLILGSVLLFFGCFDTAGQTAGSERVAAFYNVENLFDTVNDPGADDGDFTPAGNYRWAEADYRAKIGRIAQVLGEIGADVVGLAEVENRRVLDDLIAHENLAKLDYRIVHFDSPDPRGIDVALLYRAGRFEPATMQTHTHRQLPGYSTRHVLQVGGRWVGRPVEVLVCHLPSMSSSREVRQRAASSLRQLVDSLAGKHLESGLVVMGDFNANPGSYVMNALTAPERNRPSALRNPFETLFRKGYGSYLYRGRWNQYDAILTGGALPGEPQARIFLRDYLIQSDGPYAGYPFRTFSGTRNIGGYSDHLPVVLVVGD
jgi:endonuclease/exonuclease/phosphatase family metal-dependent hydrolase